MRKDIEFKSKGVTCRGWFYTPEKGKGPFPVVVMAGGWCYTKEIVMPHYADFFVKEGLAVLIFDYRCLGDSDSNGDPRQHLDPWKQIEDYKNAISFVQTLPEVDPERIGIWGISYSGGHVLITGATDPRVKCIVSVIPSIDGYELLKRAHGALGFRRLKEALMEDRKNRFENEANAGYMPMSALDPKILSSHPFPEIYETFDHIRKTEAPKHEHRSTTESVELYMSYYVIPFVCRIYDIPTLMIVAEGDDITPWDLQLEAFHQIATVQKKCFVIPKASHMLLYSDRSKLEIAAKVATSWLVEHLIKIIF